MRRLLAATLFFAAQALLAETPSFNITDAPERGVFNIGPATGNVERVRDAAVGKDVLRLEFSAPAGSVVGVWTKGYPADLGPKRARAVRASVKAPNGGVSVTLEIKGTLGVQAVPLPAGAEWRGTDAAVDWSAVGELREAVFVVTPKAVGASRGPGSSDGGDAAAQGTVWLDLAFVSAEAAMPAGPSFRLSDAAEKGAFNIGPADAKVDGADVLTFDHSIPAGSVAGLWTKGYPAALDRRAVNTVKVRVESPDAAQAKQADVSLEIKGAKGTQVVPLSLKAGWASTQAALDWPAVGELREAVFVVTPRAGKAAAGRYRFDLQFVKAAAAPKSPPSSEPTIAQKAVTSADAVSAVVSAAEKGVFNIGPSEGKVAEVVDVDAGLKVLRFDLSAPAGSVVGVWTKGYPSVGGANGVRAGVKASAGQGETVTVNLEIKGAQATKTVPLTVKEGWSLTEAAVDWAALGEMKEAVFVVAPKAADVKGALRLSLDFVTLAAPATTPPLPAGRQVGLMFTAAALFALAASLVGHLFARRRPSAEAAAPVTRIPSGATRDVLFGAAAAFTVAGALGICGRAAGPADDGGLLALAGAGILISALWRFAFTGKLSTPVEMFQDAFWTGLLAATASAQELWQAPGDWGQVLLKSHVTATLVFLVYHIANACSLSSNGRHLRPVSGALIVSTPYLFGWLLTLQNGALAGQLAAFAGGHAGVGRFLIVFLFNEAVANGISLATRGRGIKAAPAHGLTALVSAAVVAAPWIADLGSSPQVASLPGAARLPLALAAAALSQAGLWAEVYLVTGLILDGMHGFAPTSESVGRHAATGGQKGAAYSGILIALIWGLNLLFGTEIWRSAVAAAPLALGLLAGGAAFPFAKAIIETFDGSMSIFERTRYSYKQPWLYVRGAVAGLGLAWGLSHGVIQQATGERLLFGLLAGLAASGGVSLARDFFYSTRQQGRLRTWRLYMVDSLLGGFIGAALAFYLDAAQVPVVVEKFKLYNSAGLTPAGHTIYPLLSKWGRIDLGTYAGGVKLLFNEALAGVISWSIAAWLFAINRAFMEAWFQRDNAPVKHLFSGAGFVELVQNMIHVLRWGLWMSPIINTGLRMMAEATWYNQDGAIRTLLAIYKSVTLGPEAFQTWSLGLFVALLANDLVRVLIWIDHMGLRVATLVNLSFIGMNKLDDRIARFIGPEATQRYIPEGVKRFTTWAPLLIPFYIPRGANWDYAWSKSQELQAARPKGEWLGSLGELRSSEWLLWLLVMAVVFAGASWAWRAYRRRAAARRERVWELSNRVYRVTVKENGESFSEIPHKGLDVSRRCYDPVMPAGRALFLAEGKDHWPVLGNFPRDRFDALRVQRDEDVRVMNESHGVRTSLGIHLPDADSAAEVWSVTVENLTDKPRALKLAPYLEWVLDKPEADKGHTQYARLFVEMEYAASAQAVLAWSKHSKSMGVLASETQPAGFLTSRMDFIGRARSLWSPRALETFGFHKAVDTAAYPTFEPLGSLLVDVSLAPRASQTVRFLVGWAKDRDGALKLVNDHLRRRAGETAASAPKAPELPRRRPLIGHGEILPGTPQPYSTFSDDGNTLAVHTPYTPRPYDHALSNGAGHFVMVTNRGLHMSANGNSQQNPVTPDWPDTVTREVPAEAIYLHDPESGEWFSPTHHPLNDTEAKNDCRFAVDGTAVFQMTKGTVSTELTVFVPPRDPVGVYLLTVKNAGKTARKFRLASYFQIVLAGQADRRHGPLQMSHDRGLNALFYVNPRNAFRRGTAFASLSLPSERVETRRGPFLGRGRGAARPYFVEHGRPDPAGRADDRPVAAFLSSLEVPAGGERTVAIVLGQADDRARAARIVHDYKNIEAAKTALQETRQWWLRLMGTARVKSNVAEFDRMLNWLKYQAVAERLWARRGFYQTSGAFGFRDQLQDSVNLAWVDPALARKQILLHASQQFPEGDVVHWFHTLHDGRTAFSNRSHASDNLLWLVWGVAEYVRATGDETVLGEMTSYLRAEDPFQALPRMKHGWGAIYLRSTRDDSVYRHCMRALDLVLDKRMGRNGIPLIATGDWNDGLDEIGSKGVGESVWLGFFLYYILKNMLDVIEKQDGAPARKRYEEAQRRLGEALERTWREDRYLRAIHDDGTEIGVKDSGVWEIDALTAAWAVMADLNFERGATVFQTALKVLERANTILLGWPALREDTKPYLGRSSHYPEGVRENGMYSHGVQWLIGAARRLAEGYEQRGDRAKAKEHRAIAYRLWRKVSPLAHMMPGEIEVYGGQPNKQAADMLTTFDEGRMIWHGYTGAAGWMLRQAFEGVAGAALVRNQVVQPADISEPRGDLKVQAVERDVSGSPLNGK